MTERTVDGPSRSGRASRRIREVLDGFGLDLEVVEFPASTRSAADAAAAIGCTLPQIAKSLVFHAREADRPVLVVAAGDNRVDETKVAAIIGEKPRRADADFVRRRTGFAIGGVAPVGHDEAPIALLDAALKRHEEIWAAAGTPNTVFRLTPDQLARITGAAWHDIKQD